MRKNSRLLLCLLCAVMILAWVPIDASANSREPAPFYTFYLTNLPEGTKYVDLLIWLPESDELYSPLNTQNVPESFSEDAEILTYCQDDYCSYTFHFEDARSMILPGDDNEVHFFADSHYNSIYWHGEEISTRGAIRLAMLDAQGNILKVSPLLDLNNLEKFSYRLNDFYYDAGTDELEIDAIYDNMLDPPDWYIKTRLIGTLVSAVTEWAVSFFFVVKGRRGMILCTNLVSQILMHGAVALFYLYTSWSYIFVMVVLEILIYLGEPLFYWWRAREISGKQWLHFSVVSNTISLLIWPILAVVAWFFMLLVHFFLAILG